MNINVTKEIDFWVHQHSEKPRDNPPLKMEVGIQESLHIEFEYDKSKYHLRDVIIGKSCFYFNDIYL
jgi:vacuolar protein sorting-associated protein 26